MAIYKDNAKGTWRVVYRYTDWTGKTKQTQKRGFATKREAQIWECEQKLKKEGKLDITMDSFFEIYAEDKKKRIKENSWESKLPVFQTKILPYFGKRKMDEIEAKDIIAWQNQLLSYKDDKGKPYSPTYLKTIHSQELICKGWFLPPNTYDCGSFVVNGTAVIGKESKYLNNS